MSSEWFAKNPLVAERLEKPVVQPLVPPQAPEVPSPDQVRAADAIFAHFEEHSSLADIVGFYAGMMLLGDLAQEALREAPKEVEAEKKEEQGEES